MVEALQRALGHRHLEHETMLLRSDQGSQYRGVEYRDLLVETPDCLQDVRQGVILG